MKNKKLLLTLIFSQLFIIFYLTFQIIKKSKNILGAQNINPIKKENLIFPEVKDLKYFYEPKPNSINKADEWSPYRATYTINSDALNERFEYQITKPPNTFRIITLGDSFTYGLYVDTKDSWPERLEDMLNQKLKCKNFNKFEVINLGVPGYDFQYAVERFKKRGQKYNPDLIIWFIVDDLRITEKIIDLSSKIKSELVKDKWALVKPQIINIYGIENILNFQKENLLLFKTLYNNPLVFIYGNWIENNSKKIFEEFLRENYKKGLSLTITIPEENKFPNDGHPNQKGYQKIAQEVFDFIIKKIFFLVINLYKEKNLQLPNNPSLFSKNLQSPALGFQ